MHRLICDDCLNYLKASDEAWATIVADGPDNIGLGYDTYKDHQSNENYVRLLHDWLNVFIRKAKTVWLSYNSKWTFEIGSAVKQVLGRHCGEVEAKPCVQVFTFGQHNHHDLGNNHRPLLRLRWHDAPLFPDAIRVPSWRQDNGDKRADPRGRVPGDVFDFTRVVGNSKQRRAWHPTQLNEGLVERCIKLTTPPGDSVLDPFAGTGTTLRVCRAIGNPCTLIELDPGYCEKIAEEHEMAQRTETTWEKP